MSHSLASAALWHWLWRVATAQRNGVMLAFALRRPVGDVDRRLASVSVDLRVLNTPSPTRWARQSRLATPVKLVIAR